MRWLRSAKRPLKLVFALGPQREAAQAAALAAERATAGAREAARKTRREREKRAEAAEAANWAAHVQASVPDAVDLDDVPMASPPKPAIGDFLALAFDATPRKPAATSADVPPNTAERSKAWNSVHDREEDADAADEAARLAKARQRKRRESEARRRAAATRQDAEAAEKAEIGKERDDRRRRRADRAAAAAIASGAEAARLAQRAIEIANAASGGPARLGDLRRAFADLRRRRIFDGEANVAFRREVAGLEKDLEWTLRVFGANLDDATAGRLDLEAAGRLLATGRDDFWDDQLGAAPRVDDEAPATPPRSPTAVEKLRTRVTPLKKQLRRPAYAASPPRLAPEAMELDAAKDEFDEVLKKPVRSPRGI